MVQSFVTLPYLTCDVFTGARFAGNPLAVVFDNIGLTTDQMQRTAREFAYSETSFVLAHRSSARTVPIRIFTPTIEMPFAGHPTIGTAVVLAIQDGVTRLTLEEKAGPVPVSVEIIDGHLGWARFDAPRSPQKGGQVDAGSVAHCLSLDPSKIVTAHGLPCAASCGAVFLVAEIEDLDALGSARLAQDIPAMLYGHGLDHGIYLFCRNTGDANIDLRARMLSPLDGVAEDPATGSAAAALAGLLAMIDDRSDAELQWRILQGVEMGRPSVIDIHAKKQADQPMIVSVSGHAVMIMRGEIDIPVVG